jgi:hypothetical protein
LRGKYHGAQAHVVGGRVDVVRAGVGCWAVPAHALRPLAEAALLAIIFGMPGSANARSTVILCFHEHYKMSAAWGKGDALFGEPPRGDGGSASRYEGPQHCPIK